MATVLITFGFFVLLVVFFCALKQRGQRQHVVPVHLLVVHFAAGDGVLRGGQCVQFLPGDQTAVDPLGHILADAVAGSGILGFLFLINTAAICIFFLGHGPETHAEVECTPS